jgi:ATP-dependent helicase/DNAse subunit B
MGIVNPALSLGSAVHEVVEGLARFKTEERFDHNLLEEFEVVWQKFSGKKGGFKSEEEEREVKARGRAMIERVIRTPGPLKEKTVKLKEGHNGMLPNFFLSEEENIILCGKIDWLQYEGSTDSIKVLDFKTGVHDEKEGSLQLPIYLLLLNELQKRKVTGASYWYLDRDDEPKDVVLPQLDDARAKVLTVARQVKEAREKKEFICPEGERGCFGCRPFEKILKGEAEYIGVGEYKQDLYIL